MARSMQDTLEDEAVALVDSVTEFPSRDAQQQARDIVRRAVALGKSIERHPARREVIPAYEEDTLETGGA